ncbi:phospho-sugar mutase [Geomicrobium sp. JSM 1781026]|uniref:phospho-sugar mutase n=1 Tax=Geomicrobium sp. JSM 1781026 TaxID=3344580 RepID=UPI0035C12F30
MKEIIKHWAENLKQDDPLKLELDHLQTVDDTSKLQDSFYQPLAFGTGGMRGEIGVGPNRMNRFTVRKAARGLAEYLNGQEGKSKTVVIAYDSRHMSKDFALEAAITLIYSGFTVEVFEQLAPTPILSFAVRERQAIAGIMITASHNPPQYNGIKIYNRDGAQLPPKASDELIKFVNKIEDELSIPTADEDKAIENGSLKMIGDEVSDRYQEELSKLLHHPELGQSQGKDVTVVFTPLHGTAHRPVLDAFHRNGYTNVHVVDEQAEPDPQFPTVSLPNPEEEEAFELATKRGQQVGAELLVATDPDADRVGIAVRDKSEANGYRLLTGNETGLLLLHYVLEETAKQRPLTENDIILKTIVTSESGRQLAEHYGANCEDTLTGFKFIAEKIKAYETTDKSFLFGYEESYGYLAGSFVRDKDAVQIALIVAELALVAQTEGQNIKERLNRLYEQFGYFKEKTNSIELTGQAGQKKIEGLLQHYRHTPPEEFAGRKIVQIEDYDSSRRTDVSRGTYSDIALPKSNVLKYFLEDDSWVCIRPSGTEPKVKIYTGAQAKTNHLVQQALEDISEAVMNDVNDQLSE